MGYCYTQSGALVCDACGKSGGVRRRTCNKTVTFTTGAVPYCAPPALCADCYRDRGGMRIHDRCAEPAARAQAEEDARRAHLAAGRFGRVACFSDWAENVPKGRVGIVFRDGENREIFVTVSVAEYEARHCWLDEYQGVQSWDYTNRTTTKEVPLAEFMAAHPEMASVQ